MREARKGSNEVREQSHSVEGQATKLDGAMKRGEVSKDATNLQIAVPTVPKLWGKLNRAPIWRVSREFRLFWLRLRPAPGQFPVAVVLP